jgi:hypothetical protein
VGTEEELVDDVGGDFIILVKLVELAELAVGGIVDGDLDCDAE